jgi:deoxyribodipyrimidine photo-lyase
MPAMTTSPRALARDARVRGALADAGIALHTGKDHVVFERSEVLTADRQPVQRVHALQERLAEEAGRRFHLVGRAPVAPHGRAPGAAAAGLATGVPTLAEIGFQPTNLHR